MKSIENIQPNKESNMEYNKEEWENLKNEKGPAIAIIEGRKINVPEEIIEEFAHEIITQKIEEEDFFFIYRFRKNMKIGTEEEIKKSGERALKFYIETEERETALRIAEDLYGRDNKEWEEINKIIESKTESNLSVTISEDSTFAELFRAMDSIEKINGLGSLHFEEELYDNFDPKIAEKIIESHQNNSMDNIKILDFFKDEGYSKDDVSTYLPIKFN